VRPSALWRWARKVIADTGEPEPVPIFLERVPGGGHVLRLGHRAGFGGQITARIPVHVRTNPDPHPILKEIHSCDVAGRRLEAANVFALRAKVGRLLETIAPGGTLPLCYFRVPAMDYALPVYHRGDEFTSAEIGGPNLKGRDLGEIRRAVCRYLHSAGYVRDADEVQVGVLRPSDLSLVPPAGVVLSLEDADVWVPAVEGTSAEGPVVGVLAHGPELRAPERRRHASVPAEAPPAAPEIVGLLRFLQTEAARSRRAPDPRSLYVEAVPPLVWRRAEERTRDAGLRLVAHLSDDPRTRLELVIRRTAAGDMVTALEDRGITVFLEPDSELLAEVVGAYLRGHGFLQAADAVDVEAVAAPRAERLEAEEIWTHGETVLTRSEEAQAS
jgi:hypothetical protein